MSGMEVIGAIGAVASAAQLALYLFKLSSSIYEQCRRLHNAPEIFRQYNCTIEQFRVVVQLIQSNEWLQTPAIASVLEVATEKLEKAHDLLPARLELNGATKIKPVKRYWQALKGLGREKNILAIHAVLEENKSTLTLCIQEVHTKLAGHTFNGVTKILDAVPRVDQLHQEISSVRLIVERLEHQYPSSPLVNDTFSDHLALEASFVTPDRPFVTSDSGSDAQARFDKIEEGDSRGTHVSFDKREPGYEDFFSCFRQSRNTYVGIKASDDSRQINGNVGSTDYRMRQHHYVRVSAANSSSQINGDVIGNSAVASFFFRNK